VLCFEWPFGENNLFLKRISEENNVGIIAGILRLKFWGSGLIVFRKAFQSIKIEELLDGGEFGCASFDQFLANDSPKQRSHWVN